MRDYVYCASDLRYQKCCKNALRNRAVFEAQRVNQARMTARYDTAQRFAMPSRAAGGQSWRAVQSRRVGVTCGLRRTRHEFEHRKVRATVVMEHVERHDVVVGGAGAAARSVIRLVSSRRRRASQSLSWLESRRV